MRKMRALLAIASAVLASAAIMYLVSMWAGESLGGPVFSARLALIFILLGASGLLLPRLGRGTLPMRLWYWITVAVAINVIPVVMETVNAYAGRDVFSPDLIFVFFILVFIPVLVVIGSLYVGFKRQGFEFARSASTTVLPSLVVFAAVTLFVLIVPLAVSDVSPGVRISDIFALVVQVAALCIVAFMAVTIGKGEAGRPFLFISLALVCIMVQTILTAHIRLVGMMSTTEPADFFLHLAYYLLILAAYFQYRLSSGPA